MKLRPHPRAARRRMREALGQFWDSALVTLRDIK